MGHEGTPVDVRMVSHVVIVKPWASRGICAWFLEAKWLKHQVRITKTTPGPFCDFPRLWHTPSYKFSALQRWRQWKPLRSFGNRDPCHLLACDAKRIQGQKRGVASRTG
jgi:hypothetical protein